MHASAIEIANLTRWREESGNEASAQLVHEGDPVRGRETFEKRCTGCHAMLRTVRSRLQGVFGRTSGTVEVLHTQRRSRNAHIVWNESSLESGDRSDHWFGQQHGVHVPKAQERLDC